MTPVPTAGAAKQTGRALLAVALLLGVYVLALGIVFAWGYAIYLIVAYGHVTSSVAQLALLGLVVAIAIGRGTFASIRPHRSIPAGILVSPEQQPRLWHAVRDIAAEVGVRPPEEIRIMAEVNAAASEDSSWLGLRPGTRRLYLGAPLLVTLTVLQLRSVIAHEFGHYSGRHAALGPVTYRGLQAIGRIVHHLDNGSGVGRLMTKVFGWYGRLLPASVPIGNPATRV
jgi:Zn-dependent protease with chaperone function